VKKTNRVYAVFLLSVGVIFIMTNGCTHAAGNPDLGFPMYPGAKVNPASPPTDAPHMKNIQIFTSDPFEKVVAWYSQKLGKFDIDRQKKGMQAFWNKETDDGTVMTVNISNISAPAGQVKITMTKMKMKQ